MPEPSPPTESDGHRARELAVECVERYQEEGEAAVAAVCAANPEHADEIRRRIAKLREIGLLGEPTTRDEFPEELGDYRLIERLGHGGMGVVYRAEQRSLGREVALKLIRPDNLFFDGARERFQREVETVARLQHPGIVPVYGVGVESDVPFFAMELVQGCSLEDVLSACETPRGAQRTGADFARAVCRATGAPDPDAIPAVFVGTWEQVVLRVTQRVAEALQHAHERGVVHRDVKPSNIMITVEGRVMLLDFGLASSAEAARVTLTGSRLGSPQYMSPEQARGEPASAVSDVYSLGVTLYEMLTLQRAYEGESMATLLAAIELGDVVPPRTLDPRLSWEAQAVCLTAMEIDPARRYGSAGAFASDLDNVLAQRPIMARPASRWRRARRWCQRHPAKAVGLILGSILLVFGPTAFGLQQFAAARRIEEQVQRADANLMTALDAVERMLVRIGAVELRGVPLMAGLRGELLDDAAKFFEDLTAHERGGSDEVTRRAANTYVKLAIVLRDLGEYERSAVIFERVMPMLQRGAATEGDGATLRMAEAVDARAILWRDTGRLDDAVADHRLAVQMVADVAAKRPTTASVVALVTCLKGLATTQMKRGEFPSAEEALDRARKALETQSDAVEPAGLGEVAVTMWHSYGDLYLDTDRHEDAQKAYRRGVELTAALTEGQRASMALRAALAALLSNLAIAEKKAGATEDATEHLEQCLEIRRQLALEYPHGPYARHELAKVLLALADAMRDRREIDAMAVSCDEAKAILDELIAVYPAHANLRGTRGKAMHQLGFVAAMRRKYELALECFTASISDFDVAIERGSSRAEYTLDRNMSYGGRMLTLRDMPPLESYERAVTMSLEAVAHQPPLWTDYELAAAHLFRASTAVGKDPAVSVDDARARSKRYIADGIEVLRKAAAAGHDQEVRTLLANGPYRRPMFDSLRAELQREN